MTNTFMGLGTGPHGGMTPATQGLMQLGIGLLSGNPRTQGLARGFQGVAQAYSPQAAMQRQIMQGQLEQLQKQRAQEKAYENLILGLPTMPAGRTAGSGPALGGVEPALGPSLVDLPGGGTAPGQVQTAMAAPAPAGPSMIGNVQLPPGVTSEQFLRALGPQRGMQFLAQAYQPQAAASPMSAIGKLQADLSAGRISPEQYDQAIQVMMKPATTVNVGQPGTAVGKINQDVQRGLISEGEGERLKEKAQVYPETQTRSAGFANRMTQAGQSIDRLMTGGLDPTSLREGVVSALPGGNVALSPEFQQYKQAQDDWIRAKLRKESGAVIGVEEEEGERRTYFPQIGDSPQVIAQKARARATATENMIKESQGAYEDLFAPKAPPVPASDYAGQTLVSPDGIEWRAVGGEWQRVN